MAGASLDRLGLAVLGRRRGHERIEEATRGRGDLVDRRLTSSTPEQERSRTIALGSDQREGWLFVWATRTAGSDPDTSTSSLRRYLQAKKYHLALHRGTALVYDQATGILVDVLFDDRLASPSAELDLEVLKLRPIEASSAPLPPRAKGTNPRHPRTKRRRH